MTRTPTGYTAPSVRAAVAEVRAGAVLTHVAARRGISRSTLQRWCRAAGVTARGRGGPRRYPDTVRQAAIAARATGTLGWRRLSRVTGIPIGTLRTWWEAA